MALKGTAILILLFSLALSLPPFLALKGFIRARTRAARHGRPLARFWIGIGFSVASLVYNLTVFGRIVGAVARDESAFGNDTLAAFAVSWITFWAWLFLALAPDDRRGS